MAARIRHVCRRFRAGLYVAHLREIGAPPTARHRGFIRRRAPLPVSGHDTLQVRRSLQVGDLTYDYFSLPEASKSLGDVSRLPFSMKVLLENLLRFEDGRTVTVDISRRCRLARLQELRPGDRVPPGARADAGFHRRACVVDLAAMRDAMATLGGDPSKINPLVPVDLVIDHSVMVDEFGSSAALRAERRARIRAQRRALRLPALGLQELRQFPRRAAGHRHLPPGEPGVPGAGRLDRARNGASRSPIPTRWSAPTATPRWSTASACSAGASAASRPRRRCSASRSRC